MSAKKSLTYAEIDVTTCSLTYGLSPCQARLGYADDPTSFVAAHFDGATYAKRGAGLTGAADSKLFTFNLWVRRESAAAAAVLLAGVTTLNGATYRFRFSLDVTTNKLHIEALNAAGTTILDVRTSALAVGKLHHIVGSFDLSSTSKRWLYVNDVSNLATITTYTNDIIDFTVADWSIGATPAAGSVFTGDLGDVWLDAGHYLDLSIEANRRLFVSEQLQPIDLAADGSTPTASAPIVYFGRNLSTWHTNKGTGGGFTLTGTLTETTPAGAMKCHNALGSCQDTANFAASPVTLRFAIDTGYNPSDIEAIPSLTAVSLTPARISLGEDLGQRASVVLTFKDHPHSDTGPGFDRYLSTRSYNPWDQGSFWGKFRSRQPNLRSRPLRVIRGFIGDALADMETRHFIVDSFSGPTLEGIFTITAKDTLKLLDGDRAQAPALSPGHLSAGITNVATAATLAPSGIGDTDYPASGYVAIGGKEICSFTRIGDALTLTRAQYNTTAIAHLANDRIQLCLRYNAEGADLIIADLMTTYGGLDAGSIPAVEWAAEIASFNRQIYSALIAEPTSVRTLVGELIEQAGLAIWWDDLNEQVRLQVLREVSSDAALYDDTIVMGGSLSIEEQPNKCITQVWTYYAQRNPLDPLDNKDNYRQVEITDDEDADVLFGSAAIKKIFSRWIPYGGSTIAARLNDIQLGRFRDPPRRVGFELFRSDTELITAGAGYQLQALPIQDAAGARATLPFQVTRLRAEADRFVVEGEEIRWTSFDSVDLTHRDITLADANSVNLRSVHDSLFPAPVSGDVVTFNVPLGVTIGSTSSSVPAITDGGWPAGVVVNVNIYGRVQGAGGKGGKGADGTGDISGAPGLKGGTAFYTRFALNVHIYAGGKLWSGGGGGGGSGCRVYDDHKGGGGGGGAGRPGGTGGNGPGAAEDGHTGTLDAGGVGGRAYTSDSFFAGPTLLNYRGGTGGGPGLNGAVGADNEPSPLINAGAGGSKGNAIDGDSYVALTNSGSLLGLRLN